MCRTQRACVQPRSREPAIALGKRPASGVEESFPGERCPAEPAGHENAHLLVPISVPVLGPGLLHVGPHLVFTASQKGGTLCSHPRFADRGTEAE